VPQTLHRTRGVHAHLCSDRARSTGPASPLDTQKGVQGSQYTSLAFGSRCREAGVRPSMGSVGDAYDNAMCESFFSTLEAELLSRYRFQSQAEARMACFGYIEGWYNQHRRHSALGYLSPVAFERRLMAPALAPKSPSAPIRC